MGSMLQVVLILLAVARLCNSADTRYMRTNIEKYFSEPRHHATNKAYKVDARVFIHDEFKRLGLDTKYQEFWDNTHHNGVTFANVIGVLKGERFGQENDRILGVAAHYDTMPDTPGVDDNGAGVAAMLEVVRQVTKATKRENTIVFISFDGKELNYMGSYSFTREWVSPFLREHYKEGARNIKAYGFIVMDTMMNFDEDKKSQVFPNGSAFQQYFPKAVASIAKDDYEGDFLLISYRNPTTDSVLATSFITAWNYAGRGQFEIESFPLPEKNVTKLGEVEVLSNFMRSDHVALWEDNIPAIFLSDSANFRGKMIECYHKACDNNETLLTDNNLEFLGKTADVIVATLNTLSEASGYPNSAFEVRCGYVVVQFVSLSFVIFILG